MTDSTRLARAELTERLRGVVAVPVTPFADAGRQVNGDAMARLARRIDQAGVHGITALGNTGEIFQLTRAERVTVLESVARGCERAARIAGVAGSLEDVLDDADAAHGLGYDAVMVHDPVDTFAADAGLVAYATAVADAVSLPVILYVRTARWGAGQLAAAVEHPNVVAVKYALTDPPSVARVLCDHDLRRSAAWVCGSAETMVPTFAAYGVSGFTSGIASIRPALPLALWRTARDDPAGFRALFARIAPFERLRLERGGRFNIAAVKAALAEDGHDVGGVRPPCVPLDEDGYDAVRRILTDWDEREGQDEGSPLKAT